MKLHVTEIGTWKRCRRLWHWTSPSAQNREPHEYRGALHLGTLIHAALDYWFTHPDNDPFSFFEKEAYAQYDQIEQDYMRRIGAPMSLAEQEPITKDIVLGLGMIANYRDYHRRPLPPRWKVVASEVEFTVPFGAHTLCGRMDKVLSDPFDRLYVADHKTFSTHPSEELLQENEQFRRYTVALKHLYPDREVMGFFYDGLWKRAAVPKGKTMDDLFMRRMLHFNRAALDEIRVDTASVFAQMTDPVAGCHEAAHNPNRTWTCSIDCPSAIRSLCTAQTHGDDLSVLVDRLTKIKSKEAAEELSASV